MLSVATGIAQAGPTAAPAYDRVVFSAECPEHAWTPADLGVPVDWSAYKFLVFEVRASFSQWFELRVHVGDEVRRLRFHPWHGVWVRAAVPLDALRHRARVGHDMASMGNRRRDTYWYGHIGGHGPLDQVDIVSLRMPDPIGEATLDIRSVTLSEDDPGDAALEAGPFVDEFGQWRATVNRCVNSSGGFLPVLLVALSDAVDVSDPVCDLRE